MQPEIDPQRALEALYYISADCSHDEWFRVLASAKANGISESDAEAWSSQGASFNLKAFQSTWRSIKPAGGIGPGTLYTIAAEYGYSSPRNRNQERPPVMRKVAAPRTDSKTPGLERPNVIWARCEPASPDHPYIKAKVGDATGLRVLPVGDPLEIQGESMAGSLVVPLRRHDGSISSLQFIPPPDVAERLKAAKKPSKLNLPGARMEGAFLVGDSTPTLYLCEGIGQAWSVHQATGCGAVVCFGWARVRAVANELRAANPLARLVLVPDVGKEKDAQSIAREAKAEVARMPDGWPSNSDVNDLAQRDGLDALNSVLSNARAPDQRYRLRSAGEVEALPPLVWRVRDVLPAVGLAALYGPSASGKSFLALDLAAAIGEGAPWFGYRTLAGPVVYAALEGEGGLRRRLAAWRSAKRRPVPQNVTMMIQPFRLTNPDDVRDFASVIPTGAVVIIDTLNRAAPTSEENSSKDMGEILEAAKRLQEQISGLVLLVHHTGKDASKGLRGHSSMFAGMDAVLEVYRDGNRRKWKIAKEKDGVDGVSHSFELQVKALGTDEYGDVIASCVVVPDAEVEASAVLRVKAPAGGNQRMVYEALQPTFKEGVFGKAGVPATSPSVDFEDAVNLVAPLMPTDSAHRATRAREAIRG